MQINFGNKTHSFNKLNELVKILKAMITCAKFVKQGLKINYFLRSIFKFIKQIDNINVKYVVELIKIRNI